MAAFNNIAEETEDDILKFNFTNVYHPLVHKLLRPALTRAVIGSDADCMELLIALTSPALRTAIVEEGQCSCCSAAGTWCITAVKLVFTWADEHTPPVYEVAVRCVNCVINHKACDLIRRTRIPTCACHWQMSPADRNVVTKRNNLNYLQTEQLGLPHEQRLPGKDLNKLAWRVMNLNNWFYHRAETGYQMHLFNLEPAMAALGVKQLVRSDGKWIVPFRYNWHQCPCYPSSICGPGRHYDCDETCDDVSEYAEDIIRQEHRHNGQLGDRSMSVSEEDWELVKGYPKHTPPKIIALGDNNYKLEDSPRKVSLGMPKVAQSPVGKKSAQVEEDFMSVAKPAKVEEIVTSTANTTEVEDAKVKAAVAEVAADKNDNPVPETKDTEAPKNGETKPGQAEKAPTDQSKTKNGNRKRYRKSKKA